MLQSELNSYFPIDYGRDILYLLDDTFDKLSKNETFYYHFPLTMAFLKFLFSEVRLTHCSYLQIDVLNGIAWDSGKNRLFGKNPRFF